VGQRAIRAMMATDSGLPVPVLTIAAEFRDEDTAAHIERIGLYSEVMARALDTDLRAAGFPEEAGGWYQEII